MRLIDSLNFFQMPLSGIVSAMDLSVDSKGYFPHFFTRPENITYSGPLPHMSYYGCFDMKVSQCKTFIDWYEKASKHETFNFIQDIEKYCKQDVIILREGCLKFRSLLINFIKDIPQQPDVLCDEETVEQARVFKRMHQLFDSFNDDPFEGQIDESKKDSFDYEGVWGMVDKQPIYDIRQATEQILQVLAKNKAVRPAKCIFALQAFNLMGKFRFYR